MSEFSNKLNIICLESEAFYALIEEVVDRMKEKNDVQNDIWISDEEAMRLLRISSRTTLQKLRDEGKIRFSQPTRKLIVYDHASILAYLSPDFPIHIDKAAINMLNSSIPFLFNRCFDAV